MKGKEEKPDIIVLPEMFSTGFTMKPEKVAEKEDGPTIAWMMGLARKHDSAICGSFVIEEKGQYLNRFYFLSPEGQIVEYDKRHLFSYGKESDHYKPGLNRVSFMYKGWKIIPFICYDLRFPVWMRNIDEADLYIGVANWPDTRIDAWDTLLRARAIENQAYVVAVNRIGDQPGGLQYNGHSALIGYDGAIQDFNANEEVMIHGILDKEEMYKYRREFNFLADRDAFELI